MRFISRGAFVALVAVFAMSAIAATSASAALPEFIGSFPAKYQLKSGSVTLYEEGTKLSCLSATGEGSVTGAKTLVAKFVFKHCEAASWKCTSKGAKEAGEVKTGELASALVYTSKANKEVGIVFNKYEPGKVFPPPPIPIFAPFTCGEQKEGGVRNGIIALIGPLNKKVTTSQAFSLSFAQKGSLQSPSNFESEKGEIIQNLPEMNFFGTTFLKGALETLAEVNIAKELEIRA
jgi:hypothetical protein